MDYPAALVKKANELELYNDNYWHILLHYKRGIFGIRSLVDDPRFFASPSGKYDPKSELEATIYSFFRTDQHDEEHAVCRFIARYNWLKEKLGIDEKLVPDNKCDKFY